MEGSTYRSAKHITGVKMGARKEEAKKSFNIRDILDSSDSTGEGTPESPTPEAELARPDIHRMSQLKETDRAPCDPKRGSSVVTSDHNSGHWVRMQQKEVQMALQVTPLTENKPMILDDGCSFCDVVLSLPLNAADWSMMVGDIRHHHRRVCGRKRSYSESEEGEDEVIEDQVEQERIFILEEADELGSPLQRDGRTAPRPSPTPVLVFPWKVWWSERTQMMSTIAQSQTPSKLGVPTLLELSLMGTGESVAVPG